MKFGKTLGLALAGCGLLAGAPDAAIAGEDADLKKRLQDLESQVQELQDQLGRRDTGSGSLADQVDRYLQEKEKGSLWVDRNGQPLAKAVDSLWIQGSVRLRPTWSKNLLDFTDGIDDEGFSTLTRGRLGVGANLHNGISLFTELDMIGSFGDTATVFANDTAIVPIVQQAYVDGVYAKESGFGTRIGRFEMTYGDEYVVGDGDFFQGGLHFDGVRLSRDFAGSQFSADIFAVKLVDGYKSASSTGLVPYAPDASAYGFGILGNWYGFEGKTGATGGLEPYYIVIKNNQEKRAAPPTPSTGTIHDIHTAGARWYGDRSDKEKGGFAWNVNANAQMNKDLHWSTDSRGSYKMGATKWKPEIWGQFAYASGDKDGGVDPSYSPLFQDVHGRYGYADLFAFSNLMVFGAGVTLHPTEKLSYGVEARSIHLARRIDVGSNNTGVLAWEYDLVVKHQYTENVAIEAAYSLVHWRSTTNTGGADDVQRAYVNLLVSF